jgi:hypothetical protein
MVREIIKRDGLPDYTLIEEPGDIIAFSPKSALIDPVMAPYPSQDALDEARIMMPGMDVHALEAEWRNFWAVSGSKPLRSPDRAFIGWLKTKQG